MDGSAEVDHAALAEKIPLDQIDVSDPALYQQDVWPHYFRRLRRDAPVHYCKESPVGPFWSVTKYRDIVDTEVKHRALSSADGITLRDRPPGMELPMFIAMDPPKHEAERKVVQPIVSPDNLANFEGLIRGRVRKLLDG
ncbi:MAG: cytochrome P450, partial [Roseiarcus sp.]